MKGVDIKVNNKIILPVMLTNIRGFSHQAALLAILLAHQECRPWICNNFIQIYTLKDLGMSERQGTLDFYYMDYNDFKSYEYTANPWIRWYEIPYSFWREKEDIIDCIIYNINHKCYLYLEVDTFYISAYDEYHSYHRIHWMYICGFDIDKREVFRFDNFSRGKFKLERIHFDEIKRGFEGSVNNYLLDKESKTTENKWPGLGIFSITFTAESKNSTDLLEINLNRIVCLLKDYLGWNKNRIAYMQSESYILGIDSYNELIAIFQIVKGKNKKIDIRAFYSMKDHKSLMIWRILYLEQSLNIDLHSNKQTYIDLESKFQTVVALILKYNLSYKDTILIRAENILTECKYREKDCVIDLINRLGKKPLNLNHRKNVNSIKYKSI